MAEYVIIIESAGNNFAAMVPDLPGCVGAADTIEELKELPREAVEFNSEDLRMHGVEVPPPSTAVSTVKVAS